MPSKLPFSNETRVYVIAEVGNNHNGSLDRAIHMVDLAKEAGADCVKFQIRNTEALYRKKSLEKKGDDLGSEYITDLLKKFELDVDQHRKIFEYALKANIDYMCTPWDKPSVDVLREFGVNAFKVASADLTNIPLLEYIAKSALPMIVSTGMSTEEEIKKTVAFLNNKNAQYFLLHCNSTYPAPFEDINLNWINRLKSIHPYVGYSGHERGTAVSIGAVALGAKVIERHFSLDREMEGPDHAASLEPNDFQLLVEGVRQLESAMGDGSAKSLSQGELINRENLSKSLVVRSNLPKGHTLKSSDLEVKSPGLGLSPQNINDVIGKTLLHSKEEEDFLFLGDIEADDIALGVPKFALSWGIPVRPHDAEKYIKSFSPQLVEFHFSYNDLVLNPLDYITVKSDMGLVVHAPELFEGSSLLDLASPDKTYRENSIDNMRHVIEVTKRLSDQFPDAGKVPIVTNVGGFSMDKQIPVELHQNYYEILAESLVTLFDDEVEILPQTMAPFPWHFGGQRFQNLFVHADEIVDACQKMNIHVCLDISHSKLVCNTYDVDFQNFLTKVAPFTKHIHVGDARGRNGEGLQIGDGEINFREAGEIFKLVCPDASFIPEIWQGHKNDAAGFKLALNRLSGLL